MRFNRITKGEEYVTAERQLAEEGIDASTIRTSKESIIASLGQERDITPTQEETTTSIEPKRGEINSRQSMVGNVSSNRQIQQSAQSSTQGQEVIPQRAKE